MKTLFIGKRASMSALAFILSACAVGPDHIAPVQNLGTHYRAAEGWMQADPSLPALRPDWWTLYGDAELNTLMARLQSDNLSILQAEARYRQAQAALQVTQAGLFPTLNTNSAASRAGSGSAAPSSQYTLSASVGWEVDVWGRVRRAVEADAANLQASAADTAAIRLSMQSTLAQTWFRLHALDLERALYAQTLAAYAQSLAMTENRLAAGVAAPLEVAAARTQWENARAQDLALVRQRATLEHAIAVLLGEPPAALALEAAVTLAPVPAIPVGLPAELLLRRPDLVAAERRVAQANARIGVAQAAWFPSLSLNAQGGYRAAAWAEWLSAPAQFWSLGPALALTLLDGGARAGRVEQARAEHALQTLAWRQTVLNALQEVEDSLSALRGLDAEQDVQAQALAAV